MLMAEPFRDIHCPCTLPNPCICLAAGEGAANSVGRKCYMQAPMSCMPNLSFHGRTASQWSCRKTKALLPAPSVQDHRTCASTPTSYPRRPLPGCSLGCGSVGTSSRKPSLTPQWSPTWQPVSSWPLPLPWSVLPVHTHPCAKGARTPWTGLGTHCRKCSCPHPIYCWAVGQASSHLIFLKAKG